MKKVNYLFSALIIVSFMFSNAKERNQYNETFRNNFEIEYVDEVIDNNQNDFNSSINRIDVTTISSENSLGEASCEENNNTESSASSYLSEEEIIENKVMVYINPSVQTANLYVNNLGSEAENMNDIAEYMVEELKNEKYIQLAYNLNYLSLSKSVQESNKFNADIHLALHSNAGGGHGSEIYTSTDTCFAEYIYEKYTSEIDKFTKRGVKANSSLYEISHSNAKDRVLIELLFHDNQKEAEYIVNNKRKIAKILSDGIKSYIKEFYFNIY